MTSADAEGRNIRKVKISERSRSLVEVPGYPGHVVNLDRERDGLLNFLHLQGHTKREIQKILKEVDRKRSPQRPQGEDRIQFQGFSNPKVIQPPTPGAKSYQISSSDLCPLDQGYNQNVYDDGTFCQMATVVQPPRLGDRSYTISPIERCAPGYSRSMNQNWQGRYTCYIV